MVAIVVVGVASEALHVLSIPIVYEQSHNNTHNPHIFHIDIWRSFTIVPCTWVTAVYSRIRIPSNLLKRMGVYVCVCIVNESNK